TPARNTGTGAAGSYPTIAVHIGYTGGQGMAGQSSGG
ncbi:MAG: hypothetical protein JWP48_5194, partial [Actinoallomurus sp.]|nr:hypothetical protein [Actinoallomurus sp.]